MRASTIADIIVNCTPVGMHPDVDDTPLPPAAFNKPEIVVFDTVYHPENTMMLKLAAERGCTVDHRRGDVRPPGRRTSSGSTPAKTRRWA